MIKPRALLLESESAWRLLRACRWVHLPHHLLKRSLTSQVSSISQSADAGIATCKNNEDRDFAFQCSGTSATGYRQKEDSSSVYIWIKGYSGKPLRLYVDGAYDNRGTGNLNCTQGVSLNHEREWEIYNLVRENKRSYARLTAWAESGYGTVYGKWSPDCFGHFNKLPSSQSAASCCD